MTDHSDTGETDVKHDNAASTAWIPDLIYTGGRFERGLALVCDRAGRIVSITPETEGIGHVVRLAGRAILPGLINAHSHAFQRVIRGRTERRSSSHDSFWTWREMMYHAAMRLSPEDMYDAARMAFLEMALSGITAVGEFHYIHHNLQGTPYDDPNLIAKQVISAARNVGLRIALLRVAYARSGYQMPPNERQIRFIELRAEVFLRHVEQLKKDLTARGDPAQAWIGLAPHSVRAVPLDYIREVSAFADEHELPIHMHVAEQPAELSACIQEYGRTPVVLLASEGLLNKRFTAVHAIHITPEEARALMSAGASVCACPTTERNLGDGIVPADVLFKDGARIALGTDSQAQIDLLEDARELEYHLRLQKLERAVLAPSKEPNDLLHEAGADVTPSDGNGIAALATRLFDCATIHGAESIGAPGGELQVSRSADFFTVDLNDPSIAGAGLDDLLPAIVFSLARTAIRDVVVGGKIIVADGHHFTEEQIIERFTILQRKLWYKSTS